MILARHITPTKHDTRFMVEFNCTRSTVLLTENLSFCSSQNGGVLCGDVMRNSARRSGIRFSANIHQSATEIMTNVSTFRCRI